MVDATLPQERCDFYVYVIFRPNGTPCYIGKGTRDRDAAHARGAQNPHLKAIYERYGELPVVRIRSGLTTSEALAVEIALIAAIGRKSAGGPLVNMTDGGEGMHGYVAMPETLLRRSKALKGLRRSPETCAKLRERPPWKWSDESRANFRVVRTGLKMSEQHRAKQKARKGEKRTEAFSEKMRARKGEKRPPDTCKRISEANFRRGRSHVTEAYRQKLRDGHARRRLKDPDAYIESQRQRCLRRWEKERNSNGGS